VSGAVDGAGEKKHNPTHLIPAPCPSAAGSPMRASWPETVSPNLQG
jgi:hypothetical protein